MKEEIIQTYQGKIFVLDKNNSTYETRKEYFPNKMDEELDAVESFKKSKNRRKRKFKDIDEKIERNVKNLEKQKWLLNSTTTSQRLLNLLL